MTEPSWTSLFSTFAWVILVAVGIRFMVQAYPDWSAAIYAAGTFLIFGFWALDALHRSRAARSRQKQERKI